MKTVSRVRDLMATEVVTLRRNDKLSIADDIMRLGRIRHIPILDEQEEVVGLISQRDLFRSALAHTLGYGEHAQQKIMNAVVAKEIMSHPVTTVDVDTPVQEAARLMMEKKIGCLIVTHEGRLAGILTESDFVRIHAESDAQ